MNTNLPGTEIENSRQTRKFAVKSFGLTDPGRVRSSNEDHFLIAVLMKTMRIELSSLPQEMAKFSDDEGHLFLVADGIGGHQGGEHASALAIQTLEDFFLNTLKWFLHARESEDQAVISQLESAFNEADHKIMDEASGHAELTGMGTTVTMAYSLESELFIAHAGDSRCYLYRGGELHQLTRDHTVVQDMVSQGLLAAEQLKNHPMRHVITNAIGGNESGVEAEVHKIAIEHDDLILLCTDGLTDMVTDARIAKIIGSQRNVETACRMLVSEANQAGGRDNITVVLARCERA
jgi:protein phosphatase